ncbi:unnamed protein product [Bursaphelenchus xylophilus]|uniref:(pine wood nematode) hypothetical protein n=1 Tax=Bursaphelenchus xylophilus TaxID=6326 RepID=A0A1I7SBJ0_BURXY|nr:unnamed protein product [Bursaphelenchus xylophilus]CAG9121960.1 unnamed protein product [Bursaphelenchus xylophilus]
MRFLVALILALSLVSLANSSTLRQLFEEENLLDKENTKLSKRAVEVSKESSEEGSGERVIREASGEEVREKREVEGSGAEEGRVRRDTSEGESIEDAIFKRDVEGSGVAAIRIRRDASSESSEEVEGSGHGSGQAVHH